jgi:hypothetical protein
MIIPGSPEPRDEDDIPRSDRWEHDVSTPEDPEISDETDDGTADEAVTEAAVTEEVTTDAASVGADDGAPGEAASAVAAPKRHRGRAVTSILLAVLGGILLPLAGLTVWARNQLLDTDRYVSTVAPLATDPAIQSAAAHRLTTTVSDAVDFKQVATDALPERAQVLAGPIAAGADQIVGQLADKIVQSSQFQTLWDDANRTGHDALVAAITGEGTTSVDTENGKVVLKLGPLAEKVLQGLDDRTGLDLASKVPAEKLNVSYVILQSKDLAQVQGAVNILNKLTWVLFIAALACLVGAALVATDHRRGVRRAGWAITISSAVVLAAFAIARSRYLSALPSDVSQPAASAAFDIMIRNIKTAFRVVGVIGIVLLVGSLIRLPARGGAPGPTATWVAGHVTLLRTIVLVLAAGALLLLQQPAVASVLAIVVVAALLLIVVQVLARPVRQAGADGGAAA